MKARKMKENNRPLPGFWKWVRVSVFSSFVVTIGVLISGCGKSSEPAPPPPLTELRLGYFANVTHAQAVLEVASGDLQTALGPVQLKTKVFNAGPELIQALNAGEIDIGYVGPGPVLSAGA